MRLLPVPGRPMISAFCPSATNLRVCSSKHAALWHLGVEAPVEVSQRHALIEPALLVTPLHQVRAAPVQFVLQDQREGVEERLLRGLCLQDAGVKRGAAPRQAQLALDFVHAHAHGVSLIISMAALAVAARVNRSA